MLLRNADRALDRAKANGRNRVETAELIDEPEQDAADAILRDTGAPAETA